MGPKKNKKRNDDDDDELFNKKEKEVQEILKKVSATNPSKNHSFSDLNFDDEDQADAFKKKQAFDWELSQEKLKALQKIQQKKQKQFKEKQLKELQAKKLTPKQQQQLEKKLEKQRIEKQKKQQKKQEKKAQRLKELEEQKIEQQKLKQQQERENEQVEKKLKKPSTGGKCIPIFFIVFIVTLCVLQYQRQIYVRLSKFKLQSEQNFYQTLEIDSGATDRQLKEKYKRLVLKYHPDKNPNCKDCQSKFNQIIKAWQVLGSPEKRRHYDANSGFVTQIKSQSITLTPSNYEDLVQGSRSLWMIQVYDSTEKYCHYFAQFWEQLVQQYGGFIKFGRVDVWTQNDMLSYLPYKFQVFPSIYYYHKGEMQLCDFDFQNPDTSLRRCIESQYKENILKKISSLDEIEKNGKVSIVFTQRVKIGSRFKIVNKKYESDFNFYSLDEPNPNNQILAILPNQEKQVFSLSTKLQDYYEKYEKFLESLIVQRINTCELILTCENQACFILLDLTEENLVKRNYTVPKQNSHQCRPVYKVEDSQFYLALEDLKNKTEMIEKFELGLYQNGHIDLGYLNEADILNPEEGQNFQQLHCVYQDKSWLGKVKEALEYVKGIIEK